MLTVFEQVLIVYPPLLSYTISIPPRCHPIPVASHFFFENTNGYMPDEYKLSSFIKFMM
jgi:hypothetical protein